MNSNKRKNIKPWLELEIFHHVDNIFHQRFEFVYFWFVISVS